MSLLRETEVSSYDFNNVKALVEGKIDSFMGFKFIRTQRLPKAENGTRSCLAWVKSKAQFGIWNDFKVKLSVRDDMEEALQIRAKFACGATRLQEEGLRQNSLRRRGKLIHPAAASAAFADHAPDLPERSGAFFSLQESEFDFWPHAG